MIAVCFFVNYQQKMAPHFACFTVTVDYAVVFGFLLKLLSHRQFEKKTFYVVVFEESGQKFVWFLHNNRLLSLSFFGNCQFLFRLGELRIKFGFSLLFFMQSRTLQS